MKKKFKGWEFRDGTLVHAQDGRTMTVSVAEPVDNSRALPKWFKKKLRPLAKAAGKDEYQYLLTHEWMDHAGTSQDGTTFISEPYQLTLRAMKHLIEFAEAIDVNVCVTGHSAHYPNDTLRIIFRDHVKEE